MKRKLDIDPVTEKSTPRDVNQNMIRIQEWAEEARRKLAEEEAQILLLIGA